MDAEDDLSQRYFADLAAAFVRGRLGVGVPADATDAQTIDLGFARGLRLHKFKRNDRLPRVRRVLGMLRALSPFSLLDVGSGRGTFLWPLLDAFPELPVTAIDKSPRRATDLGATRDGGIARLSAREMDVLSLDFEPRAFDVVTALEVLEHIHDTDRAVSQLLRVTSRALLVSVPSKPDDNPEHVHLFDGPGLEKVFRAHGARKVAIEHVFDHMILLVSP